MPHLFRVIVPVGDIERAALFYSALLGAAGSRVSPGRHYFECEGTILACYDPQADGDGRNAKPLPDGCRRRGNYPAMVLEADDFSLYIRERGAIRSAEPVLCIRR